VPARPTKKPPSGAVHACQNHHDRGGFTSPTWNRDCEIPMSINMSIPARHADPARIVSDQRTFFVTSSTWGKRSLLQSDRSAQSFIDVLLHYRKQGQYLLHEFVVMPDHFHLLITVGRELTIERAVQLIKGGFAFRAGRELGFRAPVWQKGFSEIRISTIEAFLGSRAYIHANPVKRLLVSKSTDYLYCSVHPRFEPDAPPQWLKPNCERSGVGIAKAMP
jgi:putative transposase